MVRHIERPPVCKAYAQMVMSVHGCHCALDCLHLHCSTPSWCRGFTAAVLSQPAASIEQRHPWLVAAAQLLFTPVLQNQVSKASILFRHLLHCLSLCEMHLLKRHYKHAGRPPKGGLLRIVVQLKAQPACTDMILLTPAWSVVASCMSTFL